MAPRSAVGGLLLSLVLLPGCVPPPGLSPEQLKTFRTEALAFVKDGTTLREEALVKLGTPLGRFEGDRILTWDFHILGDGRWVRLDPAVPGDWRVALHTGANGCSLVMVFDGAGLLVRHSVVFTERRPEPADRPTGP